MALGKSNPTASTNTTVYTVPALKVAYVNILVTNGGASDVICTLSISATGTPGASEYIDRNVVIPANGGFLEHNARKMDAGENVVVNVTGSSCSVRVEGFEEAA